MSTDDPYARLRRLARRSSQRGCFTSAQARDAGLSRAQLHRLVQRGIVVREAPRVYRFTVGAAPDWRARLAVPLLSTGGIACGLTAAALYGLVDPPPRFDVLIPRGHRAGTRGRHSTRDLMPSECVRVGGLRALAPVRMVLDSVHRLPFTAAVALIESAVVGGLVKPALLEREHEVCFEGRRYIADAAWPDVRVALEFDGRDPHMRRRVHDSDTTRRNDFTTAHWMRFGVTAAALKRRDDRVFRQVARAITARRAEHAA